MNDDRPGRRLTTRKKAVFAAATLTAAFLLAEVTVRATRSHTDLWALTGRALGPDPKASWADVDAFCAYRARPGRYTGYGGNEKVKSVNSDGYISTPEVSLQKSPGTIRLAFLGESSCAGTGYNPVLADQETWPWLVAERLRAALPGVELDFLNAAGSGFTTFESMGRLWARVRFYHPDAIVVYHAWNDLTFLHPDQLAEGPLHRWRVEVDGNWLLRRRLASIEPLAIDHLIWPSQVLSKVRGRLSPRITGWRDPRPQAEDCDLRGLSVSRDNLRLVLSSARTLGMEPFVCKQATLVVPELGTADRARCEQYSFSWEAHVKAYRAYWAMIDEEVPRERVIDVTAINGRPDLFYDHVHPTPAGAQEVARLVADALLPWVRERAGSK